MRHSASSENRINLLRRTAYEVKTYKVQKKILNALLVMLGVAILLLYIIAVLYKKTGSFTVSVGKYEMTQYGLTLSENRDLTHQTSFLNAGIVEEITNIAEASLPDNLDMIDGEHNGENHVAYTFYVHNCGDYTLDYEWDLNMTNITNDLDEAIRIRLYQDGVPTRYAKTRSDGGGAEPGTTEFYSNTSVAKGRVYDFEPGEVTKFTVVIWIEGNDPDCIDWLIGGIIKLEMDMSVLQ